MILYYMLVLTIYNMYKQCLSLFTLLHPHPWAYLTLIRKRKAQLVMFSVLLLPPPPPPCIFRSCRCYCSHSVTMPADGIHTCETVRLKMCRSVTDSFLRLFLKGCTSAKVYKVYKVYIPFFFGVHFVHFQVHSFISYRICIKKVYKVCKVYTSQSLFRTQMSTKSCKNNVKIKRHFSGFLKYEFQAKTSMCTLCTPTCTLCTPLSKSVHLDVQSVHLVHFCKKKSQHQN